MKIALLSSNNIATIYDAMKEMETRTDIDALSKKNFKFCFLIQLFMILTLILFSSK